MAITSLRAIPADAGAVVLEFTSDRTPPVSFRCAREGVVFARFTSADGTGRVVMHVPAGDHPHVQILDNPAERPAIAYPGRWQLCWPPVSGAAAYKVEELVAAVWTQRDLMADNGEGYFRWESRWLEDGQTHQLRVTPIDLAGNSGTPAARSEAMRRHPDVPSQTVTVASNGKITVP